MKTIKLIILTTFLLLGYHAYCQDEDRPNNENTTNLNFSCTGCDGTIVSHQNGSAIGSRTKAYGLGAFASGFYSIASGEYSTAMGSESEATGYLSFAFGYKSFSHSQVGVAMGYHAQTAPYTLRAIAIGNYAKASGDFSMALGDHIEAQLPNSIVIGCGHDDTFLQSSKSKSLTVGFNSSKPTFFVEKAPDDGLTGKVGIGTDTPLTKLHIQSDDSEDAILTLQPLGFLKGKFAEVRFGDNNHYIRGDAVHGISIFDQQNIEIQNSNSVLKLSAEGSSLCVESYTGNSILSIIPKSTSDHIYYGEIQFAGLNQTIKAGLNHKMTFEDSKGFLFTGPGMIVESTDESPNAITSLGNIMLKGKQSSLFFASSIEDEEGEWGIDYQEGGLTFWKPSGSINPGSHYLYLKDNGFIGVGTSNPESDFHVEGNSIISGKLQVVEALGIGIEPIDGNKLQVDGNASVQKLTIEMQGEWPDFVFDDQYEIAELEEVEDFIQKNHHLPGVPNANEVQENGIDVGAMNAILLQKIEELTLHLIQMKKTMDQQQVELNQLRESRTEK